MVLDPTGTTLYFGSYHELMTYTAATNSLASEVTGIPGIVLAVSPTNSSVVVNDQLRGVLYLYHAITRDRDHGDNWEATPRSPESARKPPSPPMAKPCTSWATGCSTSTTYFTGWSVETLPANQATATIRHLPGDQHHQPHPYQPYDLSAQHHGKPQQHLQHVLLA